MALCWRHILHTAVSIAQLGVLSGGILLDTICCFLVNKPGIYKLLCVKMPGIVARAADIVCRKERAAAGIGRKCRKLFVLCMTLVIFLPSARYP